MHGKPPVLWARRTHLAQNTGKYYYTRLGPTFEARFSIRVLALLTGTNMPISAISDFCGFGSGDALRELFHARMGMSMREFRAKTR